MVVTEVERCRSRGRGRAVHARVPAVPVGPPRQVHRPHTRPAGEAGQGAGEGAEGRPPSRPSAPVGCNDSRLAGAATSRRPHAARHRDNGSRLGHQYVHQCPQSRARRHAGRGRPGRRRGRGGPQVHRHRDGGPEPAGGGRAQPRVHEQGDRPPLRNQGRRDPLLHAP